MSTLGLQQYLLDKFSQQFLHIYNGYDRFIRRIPLAHLHLFHLKCSQSLAQSCIPFRFPTDNFDVKLCRIVSQWTFESLPSMMQINKKHTHTTHKEMDKKKRNERKKKNIMNESAYGDHWHFDMSIR